MRIRDQSVGIGQDSERNRAPYSDVLQFLQSTLPFPQAMGTAKFGDGHYRRCNACMALTLIVGTLRHLNSWLRLTMLESRITCNTKISPVMQTFFCVSKAQLHPSVLRTMCTYQKKYNTLNKKCVWKCRLNHRSWNTSRSRDYVDPISLEGDNQDIVNRSMTPLQVMGLRTSS
jgi:hypothetical protein